MNVFNAGFQTRLVLFLSVTMLFCMGWPGSAASKELPLLVDLSEISKNYDGKRITVFGYVRSAEVRTGRRGSLHLELVIGEGDHTVQVYSIRPVSNVLNQGVIVQGIYHEQGRFAGYHLEHFIVADTIVRDWSKMEETQ